jgi:competence protein ComEC
MADSRRRRDLYVTHGTHLIDAAFARPAVCIGLGGFAGGSLSFYSASWMIWPVFVMGFLLMFVLLRLMPIGAESLTIRVFILIAAFCLGLYCMIFISVQRNAAVETYLPQNSDVMEYEGYIVSVSLPTDDYHSYILKTDSNIRITFGSARDDLTYGQRIRISGSIAQVSGARNPGGFDQKGYYERQGIYLAVSTYDSCILICDESPLEPGLYVRMQFLGLQIRSRISSLWIAVLGKEEGSLLSGMILGDTSGMSSKMKMAFRMSNLSHLTAVSGANVAFFLVPMNSLFRAVSGRRGIRYVLVFGFLVFFGFLTGWTASVTRALFMSMGTLVSAARSKKHDPVSAIFLTAAILLLNNPYTAVDYGFLLSFCATLALILFMEPMTQRLHFIPGGSGVRQAVACVLCTQVGMIPWLVALSGKQSIILFAVNIVGSFLSEGISLLALPLSAGLLLADPFPQLSPVITVLFAPLRGLLLLLRQIAFIGADHSVMALRLREIHPVLLFAILAGGVAILMRKSFLTRNIKKYVIVFLCAGILLQTIGYIRRPIATIVFADVGQGDSVLIILGNNKSILIDGGDRGSGEDILIPMLNYYGIEQPDITILTHLHRDHGSGLIELIDEGRIDVVFTPCLSRNGELSELFIQSDENRVDLHSLQKNDKMILSPDTVLYVLSPDTIADKGGNEDSAVLLLVIENTGILLMGDAGFSTEANLMEDEAVCKLLRAEADIIKIGHHGSKFSTSQEFLSIMSLRTAVISVGKNYYGHPTQEVLDRILLDDVFLYRTDQGGAVILELQDDTYAVQHFGTQ